MKTIADSPGRLMTEKRGSKSEAMTSIQPKNFSKKTAKDTGTVMEIIHAATLRAGFTGEAKHPMILFGISFMDTS